MKKIIFNMFVVTLLVLFAFSFSCKGKDNDKKKDDKVAQSKDQKPSKEVKKDIKKITPQPKMEKVMDKVRASHILIPFKGSQRAPADAVTKDEAKKLASELIKKIEKGEDFAKVAKENSSCPSKAKGGDLGAFGKGQMVPSFENATRALKVGDVTKEPVETQFGYHVIKRTE